MTIDYNKLLKENKSKLFKHFLHLEKIKPDMKITLLSAIAIPKTHQKAVWSLEVQIENKNFTWEISAPMFDQIAKFNLNNKTDSFYIIEKKKIKEKNFEVWLLTLSLNPEFETIDPELFTEKKEQVIVEPIKEEVVETIKQLDGSKEQWDIWIETQKANGLTALDRAKEIIKYKESLNREYTDYEKKLFKVVEDQIEKDKAQKRNSIFGY